MAAPFKRTQRMARRWKDGDTDQGRADLKSQWVKNSWLEHVGTPVHPFVSSACVRIVSGSPMQGVSY